MKAMRTLILVLAAGLLLTGCTKQYITQGTEMFYLDYDVRSGDWYFCEYGNYSDEGYYTISLGVPDITRDIVKYGNVQVSRYYPQDEVWTPLPAMRVDTILDSDGSEIFFTTYTDFEWSKGTVNIFVTASDLYAGDVPGDMTFRVYIIR